MTTSVPPAGDNQRTLAAVAYILTWLTGLIIFFVAKKEDKYARWHAVQAIAFGIVTSVIGIVLGWLPFMGALSTAWWIFTIVMVVILAMRAYQGNPLRLPMLADQADKYA